MPQSDARAMMMYDAQKKSALIAYLLWWFLGTLGVHRFYLGRVGSGVAMLLLTVVSGVLTVILIGFVGLAVVGLWWLVDAFLIPGMVKGHNVRLAHALG